MDVSSEQEAGHPMLSQPLPHGAKPPAQVPAVLSPELRRNFSVVIPAYDEADSIPDLFLRLAETFERHGLSGEIVLVDDGSKDDTVKRAREAGRHMPRFHLVSHPRNLGKTEALLTGVAASESDWVILFDADLQHSPEEIPRFLAKIEEGYDVVCGRKEGEYEKRFVSSAYNWWSRRLFRVPAHDLNSMKAFRKRILDRFRLRHDWHRFFVALAHNEGYRVGEIDIPLYPRRHGASKFAGRGRVIVGILDLLVVWFQMSFGKKPMLFFGTSGLALAGLGFLTGFTAFVLRIGLGLGFRPLLDLTVLLIIFGTLLFCFGFLADLIAHLRLEVDHLGRQLESRDSGKQSVKTEGENGSG